MSSKPWAVPVFEGCQIAVAELGDLLVEADADARHLRFGDTRIGTECFHEVVNFAGRDTVQIRLHDHGEQGLVDATATLQQGREERALPQLRNRKLQIAGVCGQRPQA